MKKFTDFIQSNKAFSIVALNLVLVLLVIPFKDPFGLFVKSYEKANPFFEINQSEISKITVEKVKEPDEIQTLQKKDGEWIVSTKNKKTFQADSKKVDDLIHSILKAKKFTIVTSSKDKAIEYGFGDDEQKIEIFDAANKSIGYLSIGSVSPRGSNTHVKWKDSNDIYLVEDNLKSVTGRGDSKFFINKKIVPDGVEVEQIHQVTLSYAKSEDDGYIILKDKEKWMMQKPKTGEITKDDMNIVLPRLVGLNADDVIAEDISLEGLDTENNFQLHFSYKGKLGTSREIKLICIGTDKEDEYYYIKKENSDTIYKLSDYKLKSVLDFEPEFKKDKQKETEN